MSENLLLALQITGIGMGLVFGAIVLLWGVIAALVRLTSESLIPAEKPDPAIQQTSEIWVAWKWECLLAMRPEDCKPWRAFRNNRVELLRAWKAAGGDGLTWIEQRALELELKHQTGANT